MKKRVSMLLLCAMLASALISCGSASDSGNSETTANAPSDTTAETTAAETEPERQALNLPAKDYDGATFSILAYTKAEIGKGGQFSEFGYDSESAGDLMNDAVHNRNMIIENRFNVTVENIENDKAGNALKTSVLAGDNDYDIALPYIDESMKIAQEKLLVDLNTLEYLDLEAEWWDQAMREDLSIGGKQYIATGDILVSSEELMNFIGLNKEMARNYDIGDLYQLANDGLWTLDAMAEASRKVTHDANGDGVMDKNDIYGGSHATHISYYLFSSTGQRIAQLDDNGVPQLTLNQPRSIEVVEKLAEIYADPQAMLLVTKLPDTWTDNRLMFIDNQIMLQIGSMYVLQTRREMISDFGILPIPKYDEHQEDYYHMPATQLTQCITVPITNPELEMAGILLEAFAYESKDTTVKAYYDYNLQTKISRDEESKDMLDIIFNSCFYDIGIVFNWASMKTSVVTAAVESPGTFASKYTAAEASAKAAIEASYEFFK